MPYPTPTSKAPSWCRSAPPPSWPHSPAARPQRGETLESLWSDQQTPGQPNFSPKPPPPKLGGSCDGQRKADVIVDRDTKKTNVAEQTDSSRIKEEYWGRMKMNAANASKEGWLAEPQSSVPDFMPGETRNRSKKAPEQMDRKGPDDSSVSSVGITEVGWTSWQEEMKVSSPPPVIKIMDTDDETEPEQQAVEPCIVSMECEPEGGDDECIAPPVNAEMLVCPDGVPTEPEVLEGLSEMTVTSS